MTEQQVAGRVSDLHACYRDLLAGATESQLLAKYVCFDVLVARELYRKGTTLEDLRRAEERKTMQQFEANRGKGLGWTVVPH